MTGVLFDDKEKMKENEDPSMTFRIANRGLRKKVSDASIRFNVIGD